MNTTTAVSAVNAQQNIVESTLTQPVVLNVTANAGVVSAQVSSTTYAKIEQLVLEREFWQENAYKTSNDQLYSLLTRCYEYYKAMSLDTEEAKVLRSGLNDYINLKGYIFNKSTHTINKIVKCIFGVDRRRVSTYGIVLRSALAKNIDIFDIADFIRESGGVEEIRLAKSPNAMTPKQKAQVASSTVVVNNIGTVSSPALSAKLDHGKIGTNTVLIGTWQADGSIVVRTVIESDTALNAALAAHYSAIKADAEKKSADKKATQVEAEKQRAAAEAAAAATATL